VNLRLVVSEVRDAHGKVLAQWLLLSNVPAGVSAAELALWYYWRWRIETYFKLLKSAGQQVEQWQQRSAGAVARRLWVAGAALVLVWQLARTDSPAAAELRTVLVRLSGRQMKRGCPWTIHWYLHKSETPCFQGFSPPPPDAGRRRGLGRGGLFS
jgi:hypothetical protein